MSETDPFSEPPTPKEETYLVIGGNGFLGTAIVDLLVDCKNGTLKDKFDATLGSVLVNEIRVFDLRSREETVQNPDVIEILGDVTKPETLESAMQGVDVVIHCVSPAVANIRGANALFTKVVIEGTKNIIEACQKMDVPKLVFTSSASVVFAGEDVFNGDETMPYPDTPYDFYAYTKTEAEKMVMKADGEKGLRTVSLRPHSLYGPRDVQLVPNLVKAAREGKLKFTIGDGNNVVDFTFVQNAAMAHILAAQRCYAGSSACGKTYFITDGQPMKFWEWAGDCVEAMGYNRPTIHLPYKLILYIALLLELIVWALSLVGIQWNPTFNASRVKVVGTNHYYNISKAKAEMGYEPAYTTPEGFKITMESFEHLKKK